MLQKITDLWPSLLRGNINAAEEEGDSSEEVQELPLDDEDPIEETFKGLRWTRVIDLRDYKEASMTTYKMVDDILDCREEMKEIELDGLP